MNAEDQDRAIDAQWRLADAIYKADCGDPDDARDDEFAARWDADDA